VTHVAGLHELADRAHGLLDRNLRIDAPQPVDVHVIRAEPRQRVAEGVLDRRGSAVDAEDLTAGATKHAELDAERDLLAVPPTQSVAQQELVLPSGVVVARIEERDPCVQRGVDRRDALRLVGRPVERRHPHAAEPERRDCRARRAEPPQTHAISSLSPHAVRDRNALRDRSLSRRRSPASRLRIRPLHGRRVRRGSWESRRLSRVRFVVQACRLRDP
jgi:hypothetical protein